MPMNKLVRDDIPALIEAEGRRPVTRVLAPAEYRAALIAKLKEECDEFRSDPSMEELADVLEVVYSLADVIESRVALEHARVAKLAARGGFAGRIWLESADSATSPVTDAATGCGDPDL